MDITIYADADSLPKALRPVVMRASVRIGCKLFFVADRSLPDVMAFISRDTFRRRTEAGGDRSIKSNVKMCVVPSGENSADDYIVENAGPSCLCITHDIPLAARLLEKGCTVIDDRGSSYTPDNIKSLLTGREVNNQLREAGIFALQQSRQGRENTKLFSDNLDRTLTRMLRPSEP